MKKKRADETLVELGLAESRSKAQAFILAGEVYSRPADNASEDSWERVDKSSQTFKTERAFQIRSKTRQDVGRGAQKLRGALQNWPEVVVDQKNCLDIGASTGGFTQVLLESSARSVVALDVGTNQLHERISRDPRVLSIEQQHVLKVDADFWRQRHVEYPFDIIVTDLSFISLERVIQHAAEWLKVGGRWIVLVKPQFELDRSKLHKGIVKDEKHRQEAIARVRGFVQATDGQLRWLDLIQSPITGGDGNVEYLLLLAREK